VEYFTPLGIAGVFVLNFLCVALVMFYKSMKKNEVEQGKTTKLIDQAKLEMLNVRRSREPVGGDMTTAILMGSGKNDGQNN
jgi:hypothetical protein